MPKGVYLRFNAMPINQRKNISLGMKKLFANGYIHPQIGTHPIHSKKWNKNISLSLKGKKRLPFSKKWVKNISLGKIRAWKDENYKNSQVRAIVKSRHSNLSKAERLFDSILQKNFPNEWKYVGSGDFILGGKNPDFMNVNGKKLLIELYEDYFHKYWGMTPEQRIVHFKQFGFNTLIIWDHELKDESSLIYKIKNFG